LEVESLKYKLIVVTRELKSIFGISLDKLEAASFRENLHTTIQEINKPGGNKRRKKCHLFLIKHKKREEKAQKWCGGHFTAYRYIYMHKSPIIKRGGKT
jgi:hypothetical protein